MNINFIRNYAITHFIANLILAAMCIAMMYRSGFDLKEILSWIYLFCLSGFIATFLSKKKLWEYLISFIILIPIVIPIMYVCVKGMIPPELILFDAFGVWYIHNKISKIEKETEKVETNNSNK